MGFFKVFHMLSTLNIIIVSFLMILDKFLNFTQSSTNTKHKKSDCQKPSSPGFLMIMTAFFHICRRNIIQIRLLQIIEPKQ